MWGLVLKNAIEFPELKNFPKTRKSLLISQCRKVLAMSTPKRIIFMQLFWKFVGVPVWPRSFIGTMVLDEYFKKYIPVNSSGFSL